MIARTQLAVLHFNCVMDAPLARRKNDDVQRYKLQFSKLSQGYVVKPIKEVVEKTYFNKLVKKSCFTKRVWTW